METESAVRKAATAWSLVMVFEGGSDDRTTVGRGRAPALQAKRRAVRRCISGDGAFSGCVAGGDFDGMLLQILAMGSLLASAESGSWLSKRWSERRTCLCTWVQGSRTW